MLRNTFIHLPHIGQNTEERLWDHELSTWQDILDCKNDYATKFQHINHLLKLSEHNLRNGNVSFFTDRLLSNNHWRVFPEFRKTTAYLDIETTGLGGPSDYITTISIYDGKTVYTYVKDKNIEQFKNDIMRYNVLVTYNGKCFDVPFIEREFGISLTQSHLDLRYILRSLGYSGGLKSIEHQLGLDRGELEGIDGYFAVLLWKEYLKGNHKALDTLLAYNIEDTINLEKLMLIAFQKKIDLLSLRNEYIVDLPEKFETNKQIKIPYEPDESTVRKIRKDYY